ncbi:nucleoside phosphorylase [Pseudonocardia sp. KRD291]|uniref:nucleoside phosphorylase n=1 Tax=Pseudonocardia sp. KRD291 TaxID=2792007 RepID=UPI001C4A6FD4|nr:nucleoside phosphorylase [Pseudonocardia sp. KRD291]MBW0105445.1 nucleoside phosphorylase [Pseudonocardia sp. KRD291]
MNTDPAGAPVPAPHLPLLEDDLAEPGVIRASEIVPEVDDMPAAAVMCWFPEVVDGIGATARAATTLRSELGRNPVWVVDSPAGRPVAVLQPGVGAPLAAMFLEELAALGVRTVVGVGGAGALLPDLTLGHAVVLGSALRDEGTSFHYLPPGRVVDADPVGVEALSTVLGEQGVPYVVGRSWTTDAVFRETPERIRRRREEGCAVVEMEASALLAVARFRGIRFAQLLLAADSLAGPEWQHRGWTTAREVRLGLFGLALAGVDALADAPTG